MADAQEIMKDWPGESREAAQIVVDTYGEPDEATASLLLWHSPGPWKRIIAYKEFDNHQFPAPHIDSVESFISYTAPTGEASDIAAFDGSVIINRTRGEMSARCHDEQANFLALNLAHDIATGEKDIQEARAYYAEEFLAARSKDPTPYMDGLRFEPSGGADPDERSLSDQDLAEAARAGENK